MQKIGIHENLHFSANNPFIYTFLSFQNFENQVETAKIRNNLDKPKQTKNRKPEADQGYRSP